VSVHSRLHAQIESVQVATLPAGNYLAMRTLVFSLAIVIPTSGRNGENERGWVIHHSTIFRWVQQYGAELEALPTVSATN